MINTRLKDYIDINPTVKLCKGQVYPCIEMEKISVGVKRANDEETAVYTGQSCSKFEPNDTLMARITPCLENGKIAKYVNENAGFGSTEFFVLRAKNELSTDEYVYYLATTQYVRDLAANSMTGASGRQRADAKFIGKIKWEFPDISTQNKITSILSAYDNLIENNNKRIKLLEQMAENLYKEWFVRFRFPGYENTEFGNGIPKGWEYKMLSEITEVLQRGISPNYDDDGKYTVISQKCIRGNIMDINEARQQVKEYKSFLNLENADTVICSTGTGTLGRVGKIIGEYPNTTYDSHVTLARAKRGLSKQFLYGAIKNLQPWFMNMGIGSTNQQELYITLIRKTSILVPTESLLKKYESISKPIHDKLGVLISENENLVKQRDLLLPRLMSGKLDV